MTGGIVVCYQKCWGCMFDQHLPKWHSWAGGEDVDHALATGQADPSDQKCGCYCCADATNPGERWGCAVRVTKLWMAPKGSEFMGLNAEGEMLTASEGGVEPALDLSAFVYDVDFGAPE